MTAKPETVLVNAIRRELGRRGIYVIKVHGDPYQPSGEPDLICCVRGRFVALEAKIEGNQPTALQGHQLRRIRDAGGRAVVVWSVEQAIEAVEHVRDTT